MNIIDDPEHQHFMLKQAFEAIDEAVDRYVRANTVQLGPLKILCISNPMPPGVLAHLSCGPRPEQNVWLIE